MDLKLKICGMGAPDNTLAVAALKPDYLGLIFYGPSPRAVTQNLPHLPGNPKKTGVFVNAPLEEILEKTRQYDLEALQLHGEEKPEFLKALREALKNSGKEPELIKVFSIKDRVDQKLLHPFEPEADFFLFDTKGEKRGGNGVAFNWDLLKSYEGRTPFFLSGGIGPDAVPEIQELYRYFQGKGQQDLFYGIDVNSKFETTPGLKDRALLETFRNDLFPEKYKNQ